MSTHVRDEYGYLFKEYLDVRESDSFGRGVYSKRSITPGAEILRSVPVAHIVSKKEKGKRCDWCTSRRNESSGVYLKKCSKCKFVYYCSSSCQKSDWPYHKIECNGIHRIFPNVPADTVRLLVRLLTVKKRLSNQIKPTSSVPHGADWEMSLMTSHAPRYSEELKECISTQVMGVKMLLLQDADQQSTAEYCFDAKETYDLACKLVCNTFSILDNEMMCIGSAVYLAPTLINHSCNPNCIAVFEGSTIKIRTIRNIKQDEQLFIGYCELLDTAERRQKYLQKHHLFQCTCDRCHSDKAEGSLNKLMTSTRAESGAEEKKLLSKGCSVLEKCDDLKTSYNWKELKRVSFEFLEENIALLTDMNLITVKLREHLMDANIELGEWGNALEVATALKTAYETYYPRINPFPGIHYYKIAKLLHQTKDDVLSLKESLSLLDKSVGILSITHGSNHQLVSEGTELMRDLAAEIASREMN